jgi:hypothetical protein
MTFKKLSGVWLSEEPLTINEGAKGRVVFELQTELNYEDLAEYEFVEDEAPYREWVVPCSVVNSKMVARVVDDNWQPEGDGWNPTPTCTLE